jgi:hypothetical protein
VVKVEEAKAGSPYAGGVPDGVVCFSQSTRLPGGGRERRSSDLATAREKERGGRRGGKADGRDGAQADRTARSSMQPHPRGWEMNQTASMESDRGDGHRGPGRIRNANRRDWEGCSAGVRPSWLACCRLSGWIPRTSPNRPPRPRYHPPSCDLPGRARDGAWTISTRHRRKQKLAFDAPMSPPANQLLHRPGWP